MAAPGRQDEDTNVPYATRREELLGKVIHHVLSEKDMQIVARKIVKAEPVYSLLGIDQADWVTLGKNNPNDHDNLKRDMMLKWRSKMGSHATLRNLVVAMTSVDDAVDIAVVEEIVNDFAKSKSQEKYDSTGTSSMKPDSGSLPEMEPILSSGQCTEEESSKTGETDKTYKEATLKESYGKKKFIQVDASIMNNARYETLIEVVNDIEFYTAICQMDEDVKECTKQDDLTESDTTYYFGTWKSVPVVVVQTGKKVGSQFQYGSWFETKKALYYLKSIKYVFGVGVCGAVLGNDGPRINLGQVAVSSEIVGYDHRKKKTNGDEHRGFHRTSLEGNFYHFLTQTPNLHKWNGKVQFGPVLSGSWLVASREAQKSLISEDRKEIAFEMEGVGIAAACNNTQVECLVVKGVSDYADFDKGDLWQPTAARNAACYLSEMLQLKKQKDQKKNEQPADLINL